MDFSPPCPYLAEFHPFSVVLDDETVEWRHSLSTVVSAIAGAGL